MVATREVSRDEPIAVGMRIEHTEVRAPAVPLLEVRSFAFGERLAEAAQERLAENGIRTEVERIIARRLASDEREIGFVLVVTRVDTPSGVEAAGVGFVLTLVVLALAALAGVVAAVAVYNLSAFVREESDRVLPVLQEAAEGFSKFGGAFRVVAVLALLIWAASQIKGLRAQVVTA